MTRPAYALIGRSYPSDAFDLLYRVSLAARAEQRASRRSLDGKGFQEGMNGTARRWRGSGEPVTPSPRLSRC